MDEPFSALDIQTRQLMENEVLALWSQKKSFKTKISDYWVLRRPFL
jgi:ABC-type nitrate/sulfonate/bicarbonate transport system ATPase subunit